MSSKSSAMSLLTKITRSIVSRPTPVQLGRWDTQRSDRERMKIGHLADHDGCGAKQCATPHHTGTACDDDDVWLTRAWFASSVKAPTER